MKKLLLLPLFFVAVLFTSCGDDNGDCVQDDFVGMYDGTKTSTLLGTTEDLTFEIVAGSTSSRITLDDNEMNIEGCNISGGVVVLGTGQEYTGNLNGTTITVNEITKLTGVGDETITWTGVKQ